MSSFLVLSVVAVVLFVVSTLAVPIIVVKMPADYFVRERPSTAAKGVVRQFIASTLFVVRNAVGITLMLLGVLMMIGPGPGILAIVFGLLMTDIPGKKKLILKLVSHHTVLGWINARRARYGKPPLILPSK